MTKTTRSATMNATIHPAPIWSVSSESSLYVVDARYDYTIFISFVLCNIIHSSFFRRRDTVGPTASKKIGQCTRNPAGRERDHTFWNDHPSAR